MLNVKHIFKVSNNHNKFKNNNEIKWKNIHTSISKMKTLSHI